MYARRAGLGDLPSGMAGNYTPTSSQLARAQDWASQNSYGTVGTPWNLASDGSTFTVPTTGGGGSVRFGFGRGWFTDFPPPGPGATAAVAVPVAQPVQPVLYAAPAPQQPAQPPPPAAVAPAPAAAVAQVQLPDGSTAVVPVQTSAPPAALQAGQAPAAEAGFNIKDFLTGLLAAPAMQPVEAKAAAAVAPYAPQVGMSLASAWIKEHQTQLLVGGGLAVAGVFILLRRR